MDDKTPDISGFSSGLPVQPLGGQSANPYTGGVSSGAYQPPIGGQMGTLLEDDGALRKKKQRRIMYAIFIVLFGLACSISIGVYLYVNSESASANTDDSLNPLVNSRRTPQTQTQTLPGGAEPSQVLVPSGVQTSTSPQPSISGRRISPTTKFELAPSDTPIPSPTTKPRPTLPNNPATQTPVPRPTKEPWSISWSQNPVEKVRSTSIPETCITFGGPACIPSPTPTAPVYKATPVTGTLRGPLLPNDIVCIKPSDTFMARKRNSTSIERLCDYFDPEDNSPYQCFRYNTTSGIALQSKVAPGATPYSMCTSNVAAETGTYIMRTVVHFSCGDLKQSTCTDEVEIFSEDLTVQ